MPNTREKLIELLETVVSKNEVLCDGEVLVSTSRVADHLIAHGVTVREEAKLYWKPVKPGEWNLTCSACDSHLGCREDANFCPECGAKFVYPKAVAPKPPKEMPEETVYCKDCENLMFSDCYGECAKAYKGIVRPDDTCEHGVRRTPKGE